jgi:hypothetical protein
MPDPIVILKASGLAAGVAAMLLLLFGWPWRQPVPIRVRCGWSLGAGIGFIAGCYLLGWRPRWEVMEDKDRFLLFLIPLAMLVDCLAAAPSLPRPIAWIGRGLLAFAAAPLLLWNTVYLKDVAGPGMRQWSETELTLWLGGLGALLIAVWALLAWRQRLRPGRSTLLALALATAAAALTVMLSGYLTGGQLGLPLAAAVTGGFLASWLLRGAEVTSGAGAISLVGLFGLLVIGRFFGELASWHGLVLLLCPLLTWVTEVPVIRRLRSGLRDLLALVLVAGCAGGIVYLAQRPPAEVSIKPPSTPAPTVDDYLNFGK